MNLKLRYIVAAGVFILFTAIPLIWFFFLPSYIIRQAERAMARACPACEFHIGDLSIDIFQATVDFQSVSFVSDPHDTTLEKVRVGNLTVNYNTQQLMQKKIDFVDLQFIDLVVGIEEKYEPSSGPVQKNISKVKSSHGKSSEAKAINPIEVGYGGRFLESLPEMKIQHIKLKNAKLEYVLKIFGKRAPFTISDINANISALGTRKTLSPRFTTAALTGKVQGAGILNFRCRADLYSVKNEDQIEIELRHQKMSDLDSFFMNEDGIQMLGEIERAQATVSLDQGLLTGVLTAQYHDLEIHVSPTPETGKLKAVLTNFFSGLKMAKTKTFESKPAPTAPVNYKRLEGQTLIKFILAGLKEAAMKVVAK